MNDDSQGLGRLIGYLEQADQQAIVGWAADEAEPDAPVELELLIDDESAGSFPAQAYREDLSQAGIGNGRHAFVIYLPGGISGATSHQVRVRRRADGAELPGSPRDIPCREPPATPPEVIAETLDAAAARAGAAEIEALIAPLARQVAALLPAGGDLPAPQAAWRARWGDPAAVAADPRKRALFIDEAVPLADHDAGSNAVMSHMRALQRLGFRVDFISGYGLETRSPALEAMGITCWHAPWVGSVEEVLRVLGERLDVVYMHRFSVVQRYAALARRWCGAARLLYCVADLHHLRLARRMAVEAGLTAEDAVLSQDAAGLRTAELLAALGADAVITHSSFEAALLRRDVPDDRVHLVAWEVAPRPTPVAFADRGGVAFVGSYGHAPNLDAAYLLLERIMPLVWRQAPGIACVLAGSDMPASLRAVAEGADGPVAVLGRVATLGEVWDRVRLSTAPLRYGAGLKGKVLDSLAGGVPCVCSPMAAEGMDLPPALAGLVADGPEAMAATILRLHADTDENARMAAVGLDWVRATLSAERIDAGLLAAIAA